MLRTSSKGILTDVAKNIIEVMHKPKLMMNE